MKLAKYKACICEGSAENAVMDILQDNELLIFSREEMLEGEVIRCREGRRFFLLPAARPGCCASSNFPCSGLRINTEIGVRGVEAWNQERKNFP